MSLENKIRSYVDKVLKAERDESKPWPEKPEGPFGWNQPIWDSYGLPGEFFPAGDNPEWRWPNKPQEGLISDPNFSEVTTLDHVGFGKAFFRCDDIPTGQARFIRGNGTVSSPGEKPAKHICPTCSADLCECLNVINNYDYAHMPCLAGNNTRAYIRKPIRQMPERCKKYLGGADLHYRQIGALPHWLARVYFYSAHLTHDLNYADLGNTPTDLTHQYLKYLQMHGNENPEWDDVDLLPLASSSLSLFPLSQQGINNVLGYMRTDGYTPAPQKELFKDLLLARCRLRDPGGACCSPENFGGFSCEYVQRESDCAGQFHPGKNCDQIGGDNCGTAKVSVTPNAVDPRGINEQTEVLVTQLSTALIKSLRGKNEFRK